MIIIPLAFLEHLYYTVGGTVGTGRGAATTQRGTSMYRKEIVYDPETRDYAMYLDDELVGFARTYHEAEVTLDQLVFELLSSGRFHEAA